MKTMQVETPALLIDHKILKRNLTSMQGYADRSGVNLRPHTKTHKMPRLAKMQLEAGAAGVTVAKVGEAEIMAEAGIDDIFIANQIIGRSKVERIRRLTGAVNISFGVDSVYSVKEIDGVFEGADKKAEVLIEVEVGEKRSGIIMRNDFITLLDEIKNSRNVRFKGVFSHDGHTYKASTIDRLKELYHDSSARTLKFAGIARDHGMACEVVSIGSTPPFVLGFDIPEGITEIRPGTYILMDGSQANVLGHHDTCAATILTTVISKPTDERVITDVGAKGLTKEHRTEGLTATEGLGKIVGFDGVHIDSVFDEHAIIYDEGFRSRVEIGDKVEILMNHICPVSNLYEKAYIVEDGEVIEEAPVSARGKLQ
ncbi:alanine racemase [Lacicoccus alkaliphilus]|uniref:D-serine deaminase, pyridoxal phosphate-dependent n=1 Tax=Lacicoccus alkaliphilus DSM 16010 TaxID=1123231 RepID=A0A1M7ACQ4_9BACL|nr:alanine racemase [Salinicoccus alkaliphilus]SHL40484.1 D-serine deaminase, pyridoxal phosphate-dependent [Salinicoccus alkaliphilus DSM 16010]